MVAVFADAPKPKIPAEPFAVTVTAPLDMELSVAPLTDTVTPSMGVCVPEAAANAGRAKVTSVDKTKRTVNKRLPILENMVFSPYKFLLKYQPYG